MGDSEGLVLDIVPYQSMGPIKLGMTVEEIEEVLSAPCDRYAPYTDGLARGSFFDTNEVQIDYTRAGVCVAVEVGSPAKPYFQGRSLLDCPHGELEAWFRTIDPDLTFDCGLTSYKFGVAVYAPLHLEEPELPPEGVMIFEKDYYQKARQGYYETITGK